MKMKWNAKKFLLNLWCACGVVITIWGLISWVEIVCKNTSLNPTYSPINLITMIFG